MASRVCGWHFGGSYRSSELCEAPGAVCFWRSSIPVCALGIWIRSEQRLLAFLCCLGTVGDIEFAAANIDIFRMGKHHDCKGKYDCNNKPVCSVHSRQHLSMRPEVPSLYHSLHRFLCIPLPDINTSMSGKLKSGLF